MKKKKLEALVAHVLVLNKKVLEDYDRSGRNEKNRKKRWHRPSFRKLSSKKKKVKLNRKARKLMRKLR